MPIAPGGRIIGRIPIPTAGGAPQPPIAPGGACSPRFGRFPVTTTFSAFGSTSALLFSKSNPSGMPFMPSMSHSGLSRPSMAFGTFSTLILCTVSMWMAMPGAVISRLLQRSCVHLKCLARWCCCRIFSSSNSRSQ